MIVCNRKEEDWMKKRKRRGEGEGESGVRAVSGYKNKSKLLEIRKKHKGRGGNCWRTSLFPARLRLSNCHSSILFKSESFFPVLLGVEEEDEDKEEEEEEEKVEEEERAARGEGSEGRVNAEESLASASTPTRTTWGRGEGESSKSKQAEHENLKSNKPKKNVGNHIVTNSNVLCRPAGALMYLLCNLSSSSCADSERAESGVCESVCKCESVWECECECSKIGEASTGRRREEEGEEEEKEEGVREKDEEDENSERAEREREDEEDDEEEEDVEEFWGVR